MILIPVLFMDDTILLNRMLQHPFTFYCQVLHDAAIFQNTVLLCAVGDNIYRHLRLKAGSRALAHNVHNKL